MITVTAVQYVGGVHSATYTIIYSDGYKVRVDFNSQTGKAITRMIVRWYDYYPHNSNIVIYTPRGIVRGE